MTKATHINIGDDHLAALDGLRVLISEEPDGWVAQGVEIDYFACGETLEEVQRNFEIGLNLTIQEHVKRYGNIEKFLRWAPLNVIADLLDSSRYRFTNLNVFEIQEQEHLPFGNLWFLKQELKEAA